MTNEEKSMEIASDYHSETLQSGAYYGAKKMADWKDQEFKEYLTKKSDEIRKKIHEDRFSNSTTTTLFTFYNGELAGIEGMMNELFLKEEPNYNGWNKVSDALPECMKM